MSPTAPATTITPTLRRRRGLTEQAAVAAVDQARRRLRSAEEVGLDLADHATTELDVAVALHRFSKRQTKYPRSLVEIRHTQRGKCAADLLP